MKKQVEIISATECKSLNSYGYITIDSSIDRLLWKEAEAERKVYKIVFPELLKDKEGNIFETDIIRTFTTIEIFKIGSIHEAEVNEETLTAVIL